MPDEKARLVYSTEKDLPRKEKSSQRPLPEDARPPRQRVTVRLDRKGRGGKCVTVIEGLSMPQKDRESLLRNMKASLGAGGTIKDAVIEIQGDHRDGLMSALGRMGYRPKRSGG
jgi:translation initiation factor 1